MRINIILYSIPDIFSIKDILDGFVVLIMRVGVIFFLFHGIRKDIFETHFWIRKNEKAINSSYLFDFSPNVKKISQYRYFVEIFVILPQMY